MTPPWAAMTERLVKFSEAISSSFSFWRLNSFLLASQTCGSDFFKNSIILVLLIGDWSLFSNGWIRRVPGRSAARNLPVIPSNAGSHGGPGGFSKARLMGRFSVFYGFCPGKEYQVSGK